MSFETEIRKYYDMAEGEAVARNHRYVNNRELVHACLGLAGEAGEVVDLIKKTVNYGKSLNLNQLLEECGDTLHYLARILDEYGYTLEDAKRANLEKLAKRFPNGYSDTAAIERKDKMQ